MVCDQFVTHSEPHEDELCSIVAARQCGTHFFRGAEKAIIVPHDRAIHDDGRTEQEWREQEHVVFIGVREGEFDDHPHTEFPHECAFTLVTRKLGLHDIPSWSWLDRQILHEDRNGTRYKDHLAWIIKHANRFYPLNAVETIVRGAMGCLQNRYNETPDTFEAYHIGEGFRWPVIQEAMHHFNNEHTVYDVAEIVDGAFAQAQESFDRAAQWLRDHYNLDGVVEIYDVPNPNFASLERPLRMVYVRCTEEEAHQHFVRDLAKAARWKDGPVNADLVVQLTPQPDGRDMVYISTTKRTRFTSLRWLQAQLRWLEQKHDVSLHHVSSFQDRAADGMLHRWYHQENAQAIFSGTPTHHDVARTELYRYQIRVAALRFLQGCERACKPQQNRNSS